MRHLTYSKFTLKARKSRLKLTNQLEEWEWFTPFDLSVKNLSKAKKKVILMDEILKTVDHVGKDDLLDVIEDLSEENKVKLAKLLRLKYEPVVISSDEEW